MSLKHLSTLKHFKIIHYLYPLPLDKEKGKIYFRGAGAPQCSPHISAGEPKSSEASLK
jgi:hypothetical protein